MLTSQKTSRNKKTDPEELDAIHPQQHLHLRLGGDSKYVSTIKNYILRVLRFVPNYFPGTVPPPCLPELHCPRTQNSLRTRESEEEAGEGAPWGLIRGWEPRTGTSPHLAAHPKQVQVSQNLYIRVIMLPKKRL